MKFPLTEINDPTVERNVSRSDMDLVVELVNEMPLYQQAVDALDDLILIEANINAKALEVEANIIIVEDNIALAINSATNILASETAAALSETNANTSANNAAASATIATAKANEATTKANQIQNLQVQASTIVAGGTSTASYNPTTGILNIGLVKGDKGDIGSQWRNGSGIPANTLGIDNDFYIDSTTGYIYQRLSGTYQFIAKTALLNDTAVDTVNTWSSQKITNELANKQATDIDLTAIAGLGTNGLIARTGNGTATTRTMTAGSTKINITNGDGIASNPTFDITEGNLTLQNLGGTLSVAKGGTGAVTITGLVKGNGTGAMSAAVPGTDYVMPSGSISGNSGTATKLVTARSISITGDITWSVNFDGSANATAIGTLANTGVTAGTYTRVTVNSKGLVTSADTPSLTKSNVGLANVDNTSDSAKPVSVAQQTALNAKLDIANVIDNLTSIDMSKALSANQGKVLKDYIDNINTLLTSNDTSLDELQEIINFIKQNKSILDTLGISNIAGLQSALDSKVDASEIESLINIDLKISSLLFDKPSKGPLFVKVSPSSIKIPAGLKITVGTESFKVITDYTLSLATNLLIPETKTAGTDYYVYAKSDATFYISANDAITTDRLIGGFHYGLIGETETVTGNKLEADMVKIRGINQYSFWDLKYRPVASPKGMVNIGGKWYDIYLLNSEHITNGTSKAGLTIAGGDSVTAGRLMPKIPLEYGGNNTLNYGKFTWFQACEIAKANSKRLISYSEFPTIAYGVLEGVSSSTNSCETVAGKIEHYPNLTSKFGIEQAAGVQSIWGADLANYPTGTTWAWSANTDSRGQIFAMENSPTAVLFGGHRLNGVNAGSRASSWNTFVWSSSWVIGCRFACDHLELV